MIRITSKQEGFRRAGIAHSIAPRKYPTDKFSPEQLKALKAEPMLVVTEIPDAPAEDDVNALTIPKLTEEILAIKADAILKGLKKDDLVAMLRELRAKKE